MAEPEHPAEPISSEEVAREAARLDGARPRQELTRVIWPLVRRSFGWTALVIVALALGEIAASARVEAPGAETFTKLIFDRLHYGAAPDTAALCLVLLGMLIILAAGIGIIRWIVRRALGQPRP
jgi:ABC-type Fe3+ transport system permease subunit